MSDDLLSTGQWRLWPQFALRGPGFPAAEVLRLVPDGLADAADDLAAGSLHGPRWDEFALRFDAAAVKTALTMQEIASTPAFRAAVAWQNPALLRAGIAPFLAWVPSVAGRTSKPRQREELVAHYWQRLCVKNDTIGFFGPVGWGTWDRTRSGIHVDPGEGLIASSTAYFSGWAIDTLAKALDADPALREWVPPRRLPFVGIAGDTVRVPGRHAQPAPPVTRELLALCDGTRSPAALTGALADRLGRAVTRVEVNETLAELVSRRWIVWRLEVPAGPGAERHLRTTLERVGDPAVRDRALAALDRLERGRDEIQAAGTDADTLAAAMTGLETEFAALTSGLPQRTKGARTAPCRALVYSDCLRSATARVGTAILDELRPLELCLLASRWLTDRFADAVAGHVRTAFDRLHARDGTVDLGTLWFECLPAPHREAIPEIERIQAELRARWTEIIDAPPGARRVRLSAEEIEDRVRAAFDAPGRGWPMSRYVSPDLLVAADNADAVERGDFELVLGELHTAMNTVGAALFVRQHPDQDELFAQTTVDFPRPRMMPMLPKEQPPRLSSRGHPALVRPEDYYVALVDHTADPHRPRTVLSADVAVTERDGRLVAKLPDGAVFDLLDVFGNSMTNRVIDRFVVRPDTDHSPRVTIDRMIVARETWRFDPADLAFAAEKAEARRFVLARRWAEETGLPRFVFVVSPVESRPFYVDFDSPVYVNILAKTARRLAREVPGKRLTVSEMLPNPEQAWLTDDAGRAYLSELRLIVVDQTRGGAS